MINNLCTIISLRGTNGHFVFEQSLAHVPDLVFLLTANYNHKLGAVETSLHCFHRLLNDLAKPHFSDISGAFALLHARLVQQQLEPVEVDHLDDLRQHTIIRNGIGEQDLKSAHVEMFETVSLLEYEPQVVSKVPKELRLAAARCPCKQYDIVISFLC